MHLKGEAKLLRIHIGESDKLKSKPVYEVLVYEARKFGLAGATVTKGILSFGSTSRIHSQKILAISEDLPLTIEIVDEVEKIENFIPTINKIFDDANCGALVTMEKVEVIKYSPSRK